MSAVSVSSQSEQSHLTIKGHLLGTTLKELRDALERLPPESNRRVLIELAEITEEDGRTMEELVEVVGLVKGKCERRAYAAAQPRYRGMVLLALRQTEDDSGRAFPTIAQAARWLRQGEQRLEDIVNETLALIEVCQSRLKTMKGPQ